MARLYCDACNEAIHPDTGPYEDEEGNLYCIDCKTDDAIYIGDDLAYSDPWSKWLIPAVVVAFLGLVAAAYLLYEKKLAQYRAPETRTIIRPSMPGTRQAATNFNKQEDKAYRKIDRAPTNNLPDQTRNGSAGGQGHGASKPAWIARDGQPGPEADSGNTASNVDNFAFTPAEQHPTPSALMRFVPEDFLQLNGQTIEADAHRFTMKWSFNNAVERKDFLPLNQTSHGRVEQGKFFLHAAGGQFPGPSIFSINGQTTSPLRIAASIARIQDAGRDAMFEILLFWNRKTGRDRRSLNVSARKGMIVISHNTARGRTIIAELPMPSGTLQDPHARDFPHSLIIHQRNMQMAVSVNHQPPLFRSQLDFMPGKDQAYIGLLARNAVVPLENLYLSASPKSQAGLPGRKAVYNVPGAGQRRVQGQHASDRPYLPPAMHALHGRLTTDNTQRFSMAWDFQDPRQAGDFQNLRHQGFVGVQDGHLLLLPESGASHAPVTMRIAAPVPKDIELHLFMHAFRALTKRGAITVLLAWNGTMDAHRQSINIILASKGMRITVVAPGKPSKTIVQKKYKDMFQDISHAESLLKNLVFHYRDDHLRFSNDQDMIFYDKPIEAGPTPSESFVGISVLNAEVEIDALQIAGVVG